MIVLLKAIALIFSGILFLGYLWWDREYLSFLEKTFMLSSAYGLLIVGAMPFRFLRLRKIRVIFTVVLMIGVANSIHGIIEAVNARISVDTSAAFINVIVIVILGIGIYLSWKKQQN